MALTGRHVRGGFDRPIFEAQSRHPSRFQALFLRLQSLFYVGVYVGSRKACRFLEPGLSTRTHARHPMFDSVDGGSEIVSRATK